MDFTRCAKWGIHVKEEPDYLDTPQLKEAYESNVLGSNRSWMCKFPCDAQAAFNVSIADSIPNGLQEPIEASLPSYSVDYPEPLDINSHVISTTSREAEESVNVDCVTQLCPVVEEDYLGKKNLEENSFRRLLNVHIAADKEQLALNKDAVVPHDEHQQGVICFNFENIQRNVTRFANNTKLDKCGEVADGIENQRELIPNSSSEVIDNASPNIDVLENAEKNIDLFSSSEKLNLPEGICSLIKDFITETDQQKKCLDKKSPKKSENLSLKCPDCDRILKRNSGFLTHMKLHSMNEEFEPINIKCKNCKELFMDRKSLSLHKNVCKSSKRSSLNSFCSNKNDDFGVPMKLASENVSENHQFKSLQKNSKESSNSKGNTYQNADDLLQKRMAIEENNFKQQGNIQISCRRSSEEKSKSSTKKRRLSQSECCLENSGVQGTEESCYSVQNNEERCKSVDVGYQESWISEIKSDKGEKVPNSKSIILSLRRFRLRKPMVLVKRTEIPRPIENVRETSISSKDTCSNSKINTQTQFLEDHLVHSCTDNEYTAKHLMNEQKTVSEGNTDRILNLRDSNTLASLGLHESLSNSICSVTYSKSLDRENNTESSSCYILNDQSLKDVDVGKTVTTFPKESYNLGNTSPDSVVSNTPFTKLTKSATILGSLHDEAKGKCTSRLPKESKTLSDLKIKIKPVVVLNRIGLLEYVNRESTCAKEFPENCMKKTETPPKYYDKTTTSLHSTQSENCNMQSFQTRSERLLNSEISSKDQSSDILFSSVIENLPHSVTKKLIMHNSTTSLFDDVCNEKSRSDSENSLEALEKQYGLKKCYVKLVRIDVDNVEVKSDKTFNENTETISELRTCEKLKLHRTDSESWEVSPVNSHNLQNTVHLNNISHIDFKELTKENRKKKCYRSNSCKILRESSEISAKNRNLTLKANHLKPFRVRCSWCQKIYYNQEQFGEHLKTHFVGYKCHNCSAKFHFWMELQTHLSGCSLASLLNCQNNKPIKECDVII